MYEVGWFDWDVAIDGILGTALSNNTAATNT
jgi:hypothetical protein